MRIWYPSRDPFPVTVSVKPWLDLVCVFEDVCLGGSELVNPQRDFLLGLSWVDDCHLVILLLHSVILDDGISTTF